MSFLTIVCVLRDGSHLIYQHANAVPGDVGIRVGAHIALREAHYRGEIERFVIIGRGAVAEHIP